MNYSEKNIASVLHTQEVYSVLPIDFDINKIEEHTVNYFLRQMHRTLEKEYFEEPTLNCINRTIAYLQLSYTDKPKNYGDIFTYNCYSLALDQFINSLK